MGVTRWLLGLLLCHCGVTQATDMRYLRHSGRRDSGEPVAVGVSLAVNTTTHPQDLVLAEEEDGEASLAGGGGGGEGAEEEVLVVRGQKVLLECEVPPHVQPIPGDDSVEGEVRWFHDDTQVLGDLRVSIMWTGRLVMSHVVTGDSGLWWCHRSGRPGPRRRLLVTIPPERPYLMYGGAQLALDARLTTREGNSITLHCVVEGGNPAPSITWLLADEDVTPSTQIRSEWRAGEGVFYSVSNMTVSSVNKKNHNTTVACVVRHPSLPVPIPVPLRLNIEYAPDFRLRRWPAWGSPVREGSSVSLLCHVDANPSSSPTWVKEGEGGSTEVVSSGEWLNLTRASSDDRGWYKCATSHAFGHFASHSVFINVLGEGRSSGVSSHTPQLLRKTSGEGDGRQLCLPHNSSLDADATSTGGVLVVAVNSTVLSMGGRTTALAAQVCSRPPLTSVIWLPPQHLPPLRPGHTADRFHAHNLTTGEAAWCQYTVLTIVGVRASDEGGWVVVAANEKSADAALIHLNVTAAAHSVAAGNAAEGHHHHHHLTHSFSLCCVLLCTFTLLP
ncbi:immunoglobulin superfamily member 10-like isoform X2 [Homarus americanus]|uniref:immunoglobulin superfamily member 10-like isoform X2 n=1 Tax=Homarus americanus TaxID=6706 RepID=UPI001C4978DA|nr:immunoglobulin superfamily member 10-like isoform X2 [Homarus americanus]